MNENFIEKPDGKPVKAFRARVKVYGNDVVVVNPQEPRESNRTMIKQKGKSSFYKSEEKRNRATVFTSMWMRTIPTPWQPCRSDSLN